MSRHCIAMIALAATLLVAAGCSDTIQGPQPGDDTIATGSIAPGMDDFELIIDAAVGPDGPLPGPFALRAANIHYDAGIGALMADITLTNLGSEMLPLPVRLEFVRLLPPGVTILNPDNDVHGVGAMLEFAFVERDLIWEPGETSLPRSVEFHVDEGVSIAFAARIHAGPLERLGAIAGVVWADFNEDGVRDANEPGIPGREVVLALDDSLLDCLDNDCLEKWRATTGEDGTYRFDDLVAGHYTVTMTRDRCSIPTTPTELEAFLVETDGTVDDFLMADFGVLPDACCSGILNGDFSDGENHWTNENSGPGLGSRVEGIVDIDGRTDVLHLDSRAGSNYYLFRTQSIATCSIMDRALSWDWKLPAVESAYGLAAVWVEFYDNTGARVGRYFVRRHTGNYGAYPCSALIPDLLADNPGIAVGCEEMTGTSFGWNTSTVVFDAAFFAALEGPALDPATIASIKVWVQSYNNAGAGVDAYFDDFVYLPAGF